MTTATKYRKKPVEIEAMRLEGTAAECHNLLSWMEANRYPFLVGNALYPDSLRYPDQIESDNSRPDKGIYIDPATGDLMIRTLEVDMRATYGDWIIRGVQGEFYPCKPDIFEATCEAVTATIKRGPWARLDNLPPIGSKLVAGNTGKVIYEVIEHRQLWSRRQVRLRDTRTGKSAGWHYPNYYRYVAEAVDA